MSDPVVLLSTGDVVGPAGGVTDNSMVLFSGTSGKLIKGNNAVVTAAGLALLDDADAAAQRTTLQLKTGATTDKTVSPNDHTIGRLLKVGDAGILSMQDMRSGGYVTGQPQDLYGLGFSVGFADGGPGGLGIPGIAIYTYGILEINSHGTGDAGAGIQRRFTDGTTGAVYTQSMATATTWGPWIKNGASAAWRLPVDSTTDLNSIIEGGWFQGVLGPTNANLPMAGAYFYLQVMNYVGVPGNCTQVAYEYTAGNPPRQFTRGNYAGTWTAWREIALTNSPAFIGTPTAPTAAAGTNTTQLANTAFVKAAVDAAPRLGVGQTWQNVTPEIVNNTNRTNTTGRPIEVVISGGRAGATSCEVYVDGLFLTLWGGTEPDELSITFTLPQGSYYKVVNPPQYYFTVVELR